VIGGGRYPLLQHTLIGFVKISQLTLLMVSHSPPPMASYATVYLTNNEWFFSRSSSGFDLLSEFTLQLLKFYVTEQSCTLFCSLSWHVEGLL